MSVPLSSRATTASVGDAAVAPEKGEPPVVEGEAPPSTILTGRKLAIVFTAMLLSLLLIALDQTILATALPRIASDFNAFSLQGWIASSFILTQTGFLLPFGQVLRIYPAKWVLLGCIAVFEIGSLVCGTAQNTDALIAGRAVSGIGAAGMFVSMIQIISQVTLIHDRPKLFGMFGAVFGLSSVIGPLMGGAFTDHVTWRWCFYINLPVGGVTLVAVSFLLKASLPLGADPNERSYRSILRQTARMDWMGTFLVIAAVTLLVMALQWGGNTKPWSSAAVIVCLVLAIALGGVAAAWEVYMGEAAMVPTSIFKSWSILAIIVYSFFVRFTMLLLVYYLPIFYQAGKNVSATKSGVSILALMLSLIISIILSGQIVSRVGRYWHFLVFGPTPLAVAGGLLYTISASSSNARLIGYQILAGIGIGTTMQNSLFAMQAEFKDNMKLVAQATSMASFGQFLGGAVGLSVAEALFSSELAKNLVKYAPTAPAEIIKQSPTMIRANVPADLLNAVITAYVKSLNTVFVVATPTACVSMLLALFIKNISVKKPKEATKEEAAEKGEKDEESTAPVTEEA